MSPDAVLFEEPSNLLKQELRELQMYNAIITAIASGKTKLSEISSTVGAETGSLLKYIDNLISLGIIKKERPVLSGNSKRTIYLIQDQFFRFWYRFVSKNTAAIISGNMPRIFENAVTAYIPEFTGLAFEEMCKSSCLTEWILYRLSRERLDGGGAETPSQGHRCRSMPWRYRMTEKR